MQTTFFEEIAITNRAYCDSLGLPSDVYQRPLSSLEANGTPLSLTEADRMAVLEAKLKAIGEMPKPARVFRARIEYASGSYVDTRTPAEIATDAACLSNAMHCDELAFTARRGGGVRNSWAGD